MAEKKPVSIASRIGKQNKNARGPADTVTGVITTVTELTHISAVAFGVKSGTGEKLFWMSTEGQEEDADYGVPLPGDTVKIWFNAESTKTLDAGGEPALGVIDIENISNRSEAEALEWFANNPNGLKS